MVASLVRRRVTRRLTSLQTMYNVLKHRKNDEIKKKVNLLQPQRNRNGTANFVNLIMTSTIYWLLHIKSTFFIKFQ